MNTKPNILWICTDQQRWDTLGAYGNPLVRTPNLDRLAREGVLFQHAYCQNPVCTPSRSSFLTGRYPRTTRCRQNGQSIPRDEKLVTRILADAGYVCGLSGKLHISACETAKHPLGESRVDDGYQTFHWSHHPIPKAWDHTGNAYRHWLHGKGVEFQWKAFEEGCRHIQYGMPEPLHQTTFCVEKALEFIGSAAGMQPPWLFSVNIFDPHHPFDPPEEYLRPWLERLACIPFPNYVPGEAANKPAWLATDHLGAYGGKGGYNYDTMSERDHRLVRAAYYAMCELVDAQVGRLLSELGKSGQRENTIVLFMSDHGEMLGDHGVYLKGPHFYEPAIRVPLIASWQGHWRENLQSDALVELVDLAPTLLEAAGLPPEPGMQGRSLKALLEGAAQRHRDDIYCEYYNSSLNHNPRAFATMLRTATHKLVKNHSSEPGELYDLMNDPSESHNLWNEASAAPVKMELLLRLCDRMAQTVDPLPEREGCW